MLLLIRHRKTNKRLDSVTIGTHGDLSYRKAGGPFCHLKTWPAVSIAYPGHTKNGKSTDTPF